MFEVFLASGLVLNLVLLIVLLLRKPQPDAELRVQVANVSGRVAAMASDLSRVEGGLTMMSGAQESRIQALAQTTSSALDTQRMTMDQKLGQALTEARDGRTELASSFSKFEGKISQQTANLEATLAQRSDALAKQLTASLEALGHGNRETLEKLKADVNAQLTSLTTGIREQLEGQGAYQRNQLSGLQESITAQLGGMATTSQQNAEHLRTALNERLQAIQTDNAAKLEEMRKTVDEKLHATLEQRLGQSFQLVSDRLEQVHRGLGEMQNLAAGVGDLKRVLTNVKTRGTWGEVQLEAMIEQILTAGQYERNVATRPGSSERVEIAIKMPGRDRDEPVWLPIDAKFPVEDYQRLLDAHDRADVEQVEVAAKALETRIRGESKTIREKYIEPPHTTDFAILYLPTEGLYAEVLRRPGLTESIQHDHRVVISGPTNLAALLNSLQMGFRTMAIEQRSSEVWSLLGAVKSEFGKFGEVVAATQKKLEAATNQFSQVGVRTRAIQRKLRDVEALPLTDGDQVTLLIDDEEEADVAS